MTEPWIWGYSDRLSARPGERVGLHLAGTAPRCDVEIARIGRTREVVHRIAGVSLTEREVPSRAHVVGCGWPETLAFAVPLNSTSGYHEILLRGTDGAEARHMLVVKAPRPAARAVLVLATNTYHAYNWWGLSLIHI